MGETASSRHAALITGAGGEIGSATAQRFLGAGRRVAGCDLEPSRIGPEVLAVAADVSRVADCDRAVAKGSAALGQLDAVVSSAGVWREGPTEQTTETDFDLVLDVNLKGTFFVCRAAIPHLKASKGCIVNLSSDAGIQGNSGRRGRRGQPPAARSRPSRGA
jgi:NAD(P)-dependent dehydrogenase (short-subunit alcohol dehydrogenase family)